MRNRRPWPFYAGWRDGLRQKPRHQRQRLEGFRPGGEKGVRTGTTALSIQIRRKQSVKLLKQGGKTDETYTAGHPAQGIRPRHARLQDLEVDEFLDDIADEFERLFNENIDYKDRLETLEEKIEQYRNIEDTLKKTLVSAQQQAEEMKQNAKKESDLILRDAELKSRGIINDSYAERQKIQRSVSALKQKQEDLRFQLKSVIESYAKILEQDGDYVLAEPADLEIAAAESDLAPLTETAAASAGEEEVPPGVEGAVSREIPGEAGHHHTGNR